MIPRMDDRERWDAKHGAAGTPGDEACEPFVLAALDRLGPGAGRRALDLAAGTGRVALELARRGWSVEAWDVSPVGLARLAVRAKEAGLQVATRALDLVASPPPEVAPFELVTVVRFLHRPLFAELARLVAPGGHALVHTFTTDRPGARPPAAYCLEPGELARGLPGLVTLRTAEERGQASLLARRERPG